MNWKKTITQIKLGDEPYPKSEINCEDCGNVWQDTEDPTCFCDADESQTDQLIEDLDVARMNGDYEEIGAIKRKLRALEVKVENKPEDFEDES